MKKIYSIGILLIVTLLFFSLKYSNYWSSLLFNTENKLTETSMWSSRIFIWICLLILFVYQKFSEKSFFLIFKNQNYSFFSFIKKTAIVYISAIIIAFSLKLIINIIVGDESASGKMTELIKIFKANFLLMIITCMTAGITEELIFRGYIQPRIENIFNSSYASIIITNIIFGLVHFTYGSVSQIIVPIGIGLVFSFFYKKYQNIYLLIFVHFLFDFLILLPNYFN